MVLRYLIEKEFRQIMRNFILPKVFIALPLVLTLIVPFAATQEVKNLNLCIIDNDHSPLSARLVQKLSASSYFHLVSAPASYGKALAEMDKGSADFILEIAPDFERDLVADGTSRVLISANAVNGVKAGLGSAYLAQIVADYSAELRDENGLSVENVHIPSFDVSTRYLYNTTLDYKLFMIPGLIAMLLILVVGFLPALNIVLEKEKGTIEQINVTPVGRLDFILSKLIPYWAIGLFILLYAMLLAWLIYGFYPAGNPGLIFLFASLFILTVSGLGLIVSNYSHTTQQASLIMFFFLVIFLLMSGLLTPVAGMPDWAKTLTSLNPLRYFIEVMRMIYLKGSTLPQLLPHLCAMSAYALAAGLWAIRSYRKSS